MDSLCWLSLYRSGCRLGMALADLWPQGKRHVYASPMACSSMKSSSAALCGGVSFPNRTPLRLKVTVVRPSVITGKSEIVLNGTLRR